jgi:hypothetical protein
MTARMTKRLSMVLGLALAAACGDDDAGDDDDGPADASASAADAAAGGADAAPGEPDAAAAATEQMSVELVAGQFLEAEVEMAAGASIDMTFQATGGEIEWNVHTHQDDETQIVRDGTGASGEETVTVRAAGTYWFLWRNPAGSDPVTLDVTLTPGPGATFVEWL